MDKTLKEKSSNEEIEGEEETHFGSDSDADTVIGDDSDVENQTLSDLESSAMNDSDSIGAESVVGSHTVVRKKKAKRTCREEIYTDEYEDDFSYYNENWTPENPFQTGTFKLHPDDPFYKRNSNLDHKEVQQENIFQIIEPIPEKFVYFKKFHKDACAEVEKMDKLIKRYFENENNLERARFVLMLARSKALKLHPIRGKKSEYKAQELEDRFDGLEEMDEEQALRSITYSIRFTDENSYKNKARRYKKRGDFLCSINKIDEAFRDARRSLLYYDNLEDMFSSYDTLGICYMEESLWEKAEYCFRKALQGVRNCGLDETFKNAHIKMIENKLKEIEEKMMKEIEEKMQQEEPDREKGEYDKGIQEKNKQDINKQAEDNQKEKDKEKNSDFKNYGIDKIELPELAKGPHVNQKNVSSLVGWKYERENGRGLCATDDIEPGDVLLVEKSYASALHISKSDRNCCICFKFVLNPIPCSLCDNVWFCGEKCMSISIVRHIHEHECEVLPYLRDPDIGNMALLTYRIITHFPWQKLKQYLPAINTSRSELAESFNLFNKIDEEHKEIVQKINMEIFFLKTNGMFREFDDLFKKSMASVYILECLRVGGYFNDDPPTKEEKVKIVSIALKHLQAAECNANTVSEYKIQTGDSEEIGLTIHPMVSLANHSCFPNALRYYINNVCVLRATRYIKKGEQIFDNYYASYDTVPREKRLIHLLKVYNFECKCQACVGYWPLFINNFEPLIFRCPEDECTEIIFDLVIEKECPRLDRKTKKTSDMFKYMSSRARALYNAYKSNRSEKLDTITPMKELQILLDKTSLYPSKIVSVCQEIFKREFLREGNVYRTFEELLSETF